MDEQTDHIFMNAEGKLETVDLTTGETTTIEQKCAQTAKYKYTIPLARAICNELREGATLTSLGKKAGFPSAAIIFKWAEFHPDFKLALDNARLDRAEYFHDKAMDTASNCDDSSEAVRLAKLQIDTLKWGAEKGNRDRYGAKNVIESTGGGATTIIVHTGIDRSKPIQMLEESLDGKDQDEEQGRGEEAKPAKANVESPTGGSYWGEAGSSEEVGQTRAEAGRGSYDE